MNDEIQQKAEWRTRLISAILNREHDNETLCTMLEAGLHQAHSEGVGDAVYVIDQVAMQRPDHADVLTILSTSLRRLAIANTAGRTPLSAA